MSGDCTNIPGNSKFGSLLRKFPKLRRFTCGHHVASDCRCRVSAINSLQNVALENRALFPRPVPCYCSRLIPYLDISPSIYAIALAGAFCLGLSKAGITGLALVNVVLMAQFFAKESVGIVLPLLILCDFIVYPLFRQFSSWKAVWPLFVPSLAGLVFGWYFLRGMDDQATKHTIGWIILILLILQAARSRGAGWFASLPESRWFGPACGLLIGVATMIANAAGPAYSMWGLVRRLPKQEFLGISARLFLLLNVLKAPFNAGIGILNGHTLLLDAALLPAVLAGIFLGKPIVLRIPQSVFDAILFVCSGAGALWLVLA